MRKLCYLGFCLVLAMGVGCAITNYPVITDNDQLRLGGAEPGSEIVNTNGKAHIIETNQWAQVWSDGLSEEAINFVDQDGAGNQTLTNYVNEGYWPGAVPLTSIFHDDEYCNPDWQGCSFWTAPNPVVGDTDIFDGSLNTACLRLLRLRVSVGARLTECGRFGLGFPGLDLPSAIELMMLGKYETRFGMEGLVYNLNMGNTTLLWNNNLIRLVPTEVFISPKHGKSVLNTGHPLWRYSFMDIASANQPGQAADIVLIHNGITLMNSQGEHKLTGDLGAAVHRF